MGVAYHAHYLVWFEQGRTEYLRSLGSTYRALEEAGTLLMVTETGVRHLKSARYDDEVEVRLVHPLADQDIHYEVEVLEVRDVVRPPPIPAQALKLEEG